jgi:pSer/pThr/pTyr-binding forkhead associated (FHA) protein
MPQPQSRAVPPPPRSVPPPLPPSDPMLGYGSPRGRTAQQLTLSYNGQHFEVSKERFVLGRSKTQADLVLEDPNVSRQHAAIERVGNEWVLADLGSTNGCYIDGQRVSRRPIADGDVIEITTHQIHCTLR